MQKQIFLIVAIVLVGLVLAVKLGLFEKGLHLDAVTPSTAAAGATLTLSGSGLDADPGRTVVFFNDTGVQPDSVAGGAIQVRVPAGARSGHVAVVVGDHRSNPLFIKIEGADRMPAGHPDIGGNQQMQGMGGAVQQASPGGMPADMGAGDSGMPAHQFFEPSKAKSYVDFELKNEAGKPVRLKDHIGKVILLNFWATWCKPCLDEVPSLERLTQRSEAMGLTVLAVSVDQSFEDIRKALPGSKLNILLDPERTVAAKYGTLKFPETWVIDKDGKIVARFIGSRNWDSPTFAKFFSMMLQNGTLPAGMAGMAGMAGGE